MRAELEREYVEQKHNEDVAEIFDRIKVLLQNAICFMQEQEMSFEEIAEYLCCPVEMIDCILNDDYERIREMIRDGKDMYEEDENDEEEDDE